MFKTKLDGFESWKSSGRYFIYKNHKIFYRWEGKGEILLCIHGFPTSSLDWSKIFPGLVSNFEVIAPDMIGFGFSDKPKWYNYSIMDQASLHEELLDSLDIHSCHILAHDYGDTVAQELLARYEERKKEGKAGIEIKSICFTNGGIFPEMHRPRKVQKLLAGPLGFLIVLLMNEKRFAKGFSEVFGPQTQPSQDELELFWKVLSYNKGQLVGHKLIGYMEERRKNRERWVQPLIDTLIPLRLINGPEDPVSGRHAAERFKELIPRQDVVLLEGIGHYPQVEAPEAVLKHFLEFTAKL